MKSTMKLAPIFILSVLFLLSSINGSLGASSTDFKEFTLFPNPIRVGQTAHLRVVAPLPEHQDNVTEGTIMVTVKFNGQPALQLVNIPLCDSTPSIVCSSLGAGDNALSFEFDVPQIPVGTYSINVSVIIGTTILYKSIDVQVTDPQQANVNQFISFIKAQLGGTAQFENSNILYRATGDLVQIGPIGYVPAEYADHYEWGSFLKLNGSEDVLTKQFEINNHYVWGLYGNLSQIAYSPSIRNHTYYGTFYAGYVNQRNQTTLDLELFRGDFNLTWSYSQSDVGEEISTLTGYIEFDDDAGTLPIGWSHPLTLVKYGKLTIATDSRGLLMASGQRTYCLTSDNCPASPEKQVDGGNNSSNGLSDRDIILIVCLTVGTAILVSLVVMMALYLRRRKKFEEEDGIFSSTRKPEYGNALVVDDIIQEVREHGNSPMIPPLNRHPNDMDEDYSDELSEDESELSDRRESKFSRDVAGPSRSPNRGRERESGRYDGRRSRSNSVESERRRSMSPQRRDDESSYYSDAGSSASRASLEDD